MEDPELFLQQKKITHFFDDLSTMDEGSLKTLIELNKEIPEDYVSFMKRYGSGEIKYSSLMIYNGLLDSKDIFDSTTAVLFKDIMFFGDDMQGHNVGFDKNNSWAVVEVDSSDMSLRKLCDNFYSFLYRILS